MSSNDMPELGSKISLISKADIRYEGKLYAVDPQDCTIALSNVKSFGTEYRKTANPVPAQIDIYDYILFRATDIKDISVVPTPQQLLYDPAIVHLSAPSNLGSRYGSGNTSSGQAGNTTGAAGDNTSCTHPVLSNMGNAVHQSFSSAPGTGSTSNTGFNPMHSGLHNLARPSPSEFLHHPNNDLLAGSRSSTPALRKPSPTVDQSTQANSQQRRPLNNNSPQHQQQKDRNQSVFYRSGNRNQDNRNQGNLRNNQRNDQQNQRQRTFSQQGGGQQQQGRGWGQQQQQRGGGGGSGVGVGGAGGSGRQRTGGRSHQRGGPGGGNFSRPLGGGGARKTATPLKFESDYDFDKANTEFEELFAKIKIADSGEGSNTAAASGGAAAVVNGQEKSKDDSGNDTGIANDGEATAGEGNAEQVVFYNKTKSFFDNISCEALERSKGRSQRTDWRKERKLNSETFGVSSARRGMFGRNGPRGSSGVGGGGGGYFYGNNRGPGGNFFGTRGGYRSGGGGGGLFKQQNKSPYRPQQQPQVANA